MSLILFFILILTLVFGRWSGIPLSWLLKKIVSNNYGAIIVFFLLILAIIRMFRLFVGETSIPGFSLPRISHRTHRAKKTKE